SGAAQGERPTNGNSRQNRRRTETAPDRQTDQDSNRQRSARDRQPTSGERQRPDASRPDTRRADGPWSERTDTPRGVSRERPAAPATGAVRRDDARPSSFSGDRNRDGRPGSARPTGAHPGGPRPGNFRNGRPQARPNGTTLDESVARPARRPAAPTAPFTPTAPAGPPAPVAAPVFVNADSLNLSPVESFADLNVRPEVRAAVNAMGITAPTPIQAQGIPVMLAGRDIVGQAKTGSGKTLAFAIPTVERCDPAVRGVQALILVPTRELAIQVGHVVEQLARPRRLKMTLLYGGRSLVPEARALAGGAQIVVGTPGRTLDHLRQRNLSIQNLRMFVLDEGDEMLDRGFAPDVERILAHTPADSRQTALFSATVPPWVMQTAARHLRTPVLVRVDTQEAPAEIEHIVYDVDANTRSTALRTLLDQRGDGPVIVFGRTKHGVKKLARQLETEGFPVVALHGNLSQNARERAMVELRSGNLPILVATNVAARGIDIRDVGQVINYEVPESAELFTHRVGRTGRMGRSGEAITFVTPDEAPKWRQIERALGKSLPRQLWSVDGVPVPVSTTPAPSEDADRSARGRSGQGRQVAAAGPRFGADSPRPRWRRSGR
ncbi:MAG: DEAD/DEAH box helicase, partial [Chloroflexota bacterium]